MNRRVHLPPSWALIDESSTRVLFQGYGEPGSRSVARLVSGGAAAERKRMELADCGVTQWGAVVICTIEGIPTRPVFLNNSPPTLRNPEIGSRAPSTARRGTAARWSPSSFHCLKAGSWGFLNESQSLRPVSVGSLRWRARRSASARHIAVPLFVVSDWRNVSNGGRSRCIESDRTTRVATAADIVAVVLNTR